MLTNDLHQIVEIRRIDVLKQVILIKHRLFNVSQKKKRDKFIRKKSELFYFLPRNSNRS